VDECEVSDADVDLRPAIIIRQHKLVNSLSPYSDVRSSFGRVLSKTLR
jgi:hypothetical protein